MGEKNKNINSFKGEYFFLSNFYEAPVTYGGITYQNNEAAFQAQKVAPKKGEIPFVDPRLEFANLSPSEAKKKGRHVILRKDWEQVKYGIMRAIVYAKFSQNEDLKEKLLATDDAYLEEGNTWGDKTWGTVNGRGKNFLGQILMDIRDALYCEEHYIGSSYDATTGLLCFEECNYLLDLLDPERKFTEHYIYMD